MLRELRCSLQSVERAVGLPELLVRLTEVVVGYPEVRVDDGGLPRVCRSGFEIPGVEPLRPGIPERQTHDYIRHGTTCLYAALRVLDGVVLGECRPKRTNAFVSPSL